ncbi:MAG: hypothetical protein HZA89_13165 [Verrucomicrobia bacterium]|nr:hypothetical protein [Verrucomicrobiota bacterium]
MKTVRRETGSALTPWIVVVAVAAVAGGVIFKMYSTAETQQRELAALRAEKKELDALRTEAQELPKLRAIAREMEVVKKEAETVHRLRNEVSQLRAEQQQFIKAQGEVQQLKGALQQQQAQAQELRAQQAQLQAAAMAAQRTAQGAVPNPAATQAAQAEALKNACIANLKQLDGATQQWALENKLTANSAVNAEGIKNYLRGRMLPVCPAGGTYSFTIVKDTPRCTIPGHALQ